MVDSRDPEKDQAYERTAPAPTSPSSSNGSAIDCEKIEHTSRRSSNDSDDSIEYTQDRLAPIQPISTFDRFRDPSNAQADITRTKSRASVWTNASGPASFEVDFTTDDPDEPTNWPVWYRAMILGFISFGTWATVLYSTSYTSSMPGMMEEFNEPSETVATLGLTTYMIGLAVGSLVLAPVSEIYGRQPIYIGSLLVFCLMTLPCALATNLSQVQGVRFLG